MINYISLNKKKSYNSLDNNKFFVNEKIIVSDLDYYYSNVIARASKTMSECRNVKINLKSTGTEG